MAFRINEGCIICAKCDNVCPMDAIYLAEMSYMINPRKCNECKNINNEPICVIVCPVNVIVKDLKNEK